MRIHLLAAIASVGATAIANAAVAQVAVVEDVKSKTANVEFMDYVPAGKIIKLGTGERLVLGYMKSCVREVITGGVVMVGAERSEVTLGEVQRTQVPCGGDQAQLPANQGGQSAGLVFRNMEGGARSQTTAQTTVFGLSPVFEVAGRGSLTVERTDRPGERLQFAVDDKQLLRGAFFDLAKTNQTLTAGATYVATFGGKKVTFVVAPDAQPGASPVIGRLVRIEMAKKAQ